VTNDCFQVPGWANVWALGDCALVPDPLNPGKFYPPTAQHATREAPGSPIEVIAIGHQFWWEYRFPALNVVTANELHIPVSDPANPDSDVYQAALRRHKSQLLGSSTGGQNRPYSKPCKPYVG
jgi:hypothetical protein